MSSESFERELSPNQVHLDLILADYGKVAGGKLDLMGAGWSNCQGPHVGPCAVAVIAKVPASWSGQQVLINVHLVDEDGKRVNNAPAAECKLVPTAGPRAGEAIDVPFVLPVPPIMVVPNRRYEWRATVNGETHADWRVGFFVGDGTPPKGMLRPAS